MAKINDLKNIVMDAMMEFYQEYIKPDTRKMMEEVLEEKLESKLEEKLDQKFEEKFDEHLGPIKANIHPKWFPETKVTCACGNTFTTGSILPEIRVEICSSCHPFFTGQQRF